MNFLDILKAFLIGVNTGSHGWLPISSTGHMILFEQFCGMNVSEQFMEMFRVVIQFGSILAVVILYWKRLFPFCPSAGKAERKSIWKLWLKIVIAVIPAGVVGVLFDDILDKYLYNYITVAAALIIYGVAFIVIERMHKTKKYPITSVDDIDAKTALKIGAFQTLSLIPGNIPLRLYNNRSYVRRSFPYTCGRVLVLPCRSRYVRRKSFENREIRRELRACVLLVRDCHARCRNSYRICRVLVAIKFLVGFVRRHSFEFFGWYRIVLGIAVIAYFLITK